ncbi:MAG TPA: hypothetical protein VG994_03550 [Steroidobacteraceae bacterium]|nr:hypothetical protein [Steroidobacteraceae bacterium]
MKARNKAVFGIYAAPAQAETAFNELLKAGFTSDDVSVLLPDRAGARPLVHEKETKAPEGTATGVTTGGVIGGALGVLVGLGTLAIPGIGPLLAAGPIVAGLAGLGAGGAVGGLIGALVGLGIPEYEAKRYEGRVRQGGVLLSVHCETAGEVLRAKEVLTGSGASDVATAGEAHGARDDAHKRERSGAREPIDAREGAGTRERIDVREGAGTRERIDAHDGVGAGAPIGAGDGAGTRKTIDARGTERVERVERREIPVSAAPPGHAERVERVEKREIPASAAPQGRGVYKDDRIRR